MRLTSHFTLVANSITYLTPSHSDISSCTWCKAHTPLATPLVPAPNANSFCRECTCIRRHEMSFHRDIPIPSCLGELLCPAAHAPSATFCLRWMTSLSRSCPRPAPLRRRQPSIQRTSFCSGEHFHAACVAFDG